MKKLIKEIFTEENINYIPYNHVVKMDEIEKSGNVFYRLKLISGGDLIIEKK